MISEEEKELVRRLQNKETRDAALGDLDRLYRNRIISLAIPYLGSESEADDVFQLVLMKVHRSIETKYVHRLPLFSWLARITINACKDHLQARKRKREAYDPGSNTAEGNNKSEFRMMELLVSGSSAGSVSAHPLYEPPCDSVNREGLMSLQKTRSILSACVDSLSEKHRTILLMCDIDGMTYEQIADVLDIPKGTVMSRLFHARKYFEEALNSYGYSKEDLWKRLA